jgi:hypothetical protein
MYSWPEHVSPSVMDAYAQLCSPPAPLPVLLEGGGAFFPVLTMPYFFSNNSTGLDPSPTPAPSWKGIGAKDAGVCSKSAASEALSRVCEVDVAFLLLFLVVDESFLLLFVFVDESFFDAADDAFNLSLLFFAPERNDRVVSPDAADVSSTSTMEAVMVRIVALYLTAADDC